MLPPPERLAKIRTFVQNPPSTPLLNFLESHEVLNSISLEKDCPYFNGRLSAFQREKGVEELVKLVVEIGQNARKNDRAFCENMCIGVPGPADASHHSYGFPSYNVLHGECSLMKLTNRFMFGDQNFYSFMKLPGYDEAATPILPIASQLSATPEKRLLSLTGPSGVGKSFYLQYLVRRLRVLPGVCVLYLANPALFLVPDQINFGLILMELLYSIAHCVDEQMMALFAGTLSKMSPKGNGESQLALLREVFKKVIESLNGQNKHLFIVLDQENVYDRHKQENPTSDEAKLRLYLVNGCDDKAYVLSPLSFASTKTPNTKRFVRMLSDAEILSALKSRCCPAERYILSNVANVEDKRARSRIDLVLNAVGRCPRDLHNLLNTDSDITNEDPSDSEIMPLTYSATDITNTTAKACAGTSVPSAAGHAVEASAEFDARKPLDADEMEYYKLFVPSLKKRCSTFRSATSKIVSGHEKFFNGLGNNAQEAFLLMLSIADKSPAIGKNGLYIYDTLPTKPQSPAESPKPTSTKSDDVLTPTEEMHQNIDELQPDFDLTESIENQSVILSSEGSCNIRQSSSHNASSSFKSGDNDSGFVDISFFSQIEGYTDYADISIASRALDGRHFFIDQYGYVHPFSGRVFKAIRDHHQMHNVVKMQALYEQLGEDVAFAGPLFELLFFSEFLDPQSAFVLNLSTASSSRHLFTKLAIPIAKKIDKLDFRSILDSSSGDNVIYKCPPGFPIIDFCIVCPNDTLSNADEFNMVPNIPWIEDRWKVQTRRAKNSTIFLCQIAINSTAHNKGDVKIAFDPNKAPDTKKSKQDSGDDDDEELMSLETFEIRSPDRTKKLKDLVRSFVEISINTGHLPHVNFLWITREFGITDKYHSQSIICCNHSVVKKSLSEVRTMKISSIESRTEGQI